MAKKELSLTIQGASFPFGPLDCTKKYMSVIVSSSVSQQTHHVILILSLFLFLCHIKCHINNVIYSRIHRSPNYRFPAFIVCKSPSRHSISRMDRLKKY